MRPIDRMNIATDAARTMASEARSNGSSPVSSSPSNKPAPLQPFPPANSMTSSSITTPSKDQFIRSGQSVPLTPTQGHHGHGHAHRHSLSEQLRGIPSSPRANRHSYISQAVLQDLFNNPPHGQKNASVFEGRDWKTIKVGEVIDPEQVYFVELDTSVEDATNLLITAGSPNVVLIRSNKSSRVALHTFDYSDLNAYLLLVVGLARPHESNISSFNELVRKGREGQPIPVRDVKEISRKEPIITLPHTATLAQAVEIFGSGVHRIVLHREGSEDVQGVLTQLRLVQFFWENGRVFQEVDRIYSATLQDLNIGARSVRSVNGDRPVTEALELMNRESITSLPILDNSSNVVGNISHVDTRLLTKSTSLPLLRSSCIHFISVILSERGMDDGADSYPVFYVNLFSTLAHTVAKLVATRSHRMWIVESPSQAPSPAPSAPQTPAAISHVQASPPNFPSPTNGPPYTPASGTAVSASALPGQNMSGRLTGVISLTDVLNIIARASGLSVYDPNEARRRRRGSSGSSMLASNESARSSSIDLSRSASRSSSRR